MKVTGLGEFGLIAALGRIVSRSAPGLVIGIGDDAAVWQASPTPEIATTDILVEGIHFTLDTAHWDELGWKAVAVNLSDVAAMGGQPRYVLITLALPPSTEVAGVEELYRGATELCDRFGVVIAGGDTVRSPGPVIVSVAAFGEASVFGGRERLLRRDAARVGDLVGVTGTLGGSAGGLAMLLEKRAFPPPVAESLRAAHLKPMPRVREAQVLLAAGVAAAIDVSDGLVGDLGKLAQASGVAAVLDPAKVPLPPVLRQAFPERARDFALYGGEDYELLFAAPPPALAAAGERLRSLGLPPIAVLGEIVAGPAGKVWLRDESGSLIEPKSGGYDAFAGQTDTTAGR